MCEKAAALSALLAIGLSSPAALRADDEAAALLRGADAARAPLRSGVTRLVVMRRTPERVEELGELDVYAAAERAVLVFRTGAQRERRLLVADGKTWLIVPGTRHPVPLAGQQRLLGAAALADLVGPPLASRYAATLRPAAEEVDGEPCRVLDLAALEAEEAYPSATLWLSGAEGLPRRLRLRLRSGREARELDFAYRGEQGRPLLARIEVRDLLRKQDETTNLELLRHDPRPPERAVFTLEGARALP